MKLVNGKDATYFETFRWSWNPDVEEAEMKLSESDSKFVQGEGWRRTFTIENSFIIELTDNPRKRRYSLTKCIS